MDPHRLIVLAVLAAALVAGCKGKSPAKPVCQPGQTGECLCEPRRPGIQICKDDGSGWDKCKNCVCEPDCGEKECGDDGCGGVCGQCGGEQRCVATTGKCVETCEPGDKKCVGQQLWKCTAQGTWDSATTCTEARICFEGECCTPRCAGIACGSDGCGGSCGNCPEEHFCNELGKCELSNAAYCRRLTPLHGSDSSDSGWRIDPEVHCAVWWTGPALERFRYEGGCIECRANGLGRCWQPNNGQGTNWEYEGNFKDGKFHGEGVYTYGDGKVYDGQWRDDKRHGRGVLEYGDGQEYDGQWKDGKRHGRGAFIYGNGNTYEGEWKDDRRHGQGTRFYDDGTYKGHWKDDLKDGYGTYTYENGNHYEGEWKGGKMHGKGIFAWANRQRYEGEFKDGKKHGQGVYTWPDGAKYDGEWKEDNRHGWAVYTSLHGDKFKGDWKDDKMTGGHWKTPGCRVGEKVEYRGYANQSGYDGVVVNCASGMHLVEITYVYINCTFCYPQLGACRCTGNKDINHGSTGTTMWIPDNCLEQYVKF